MPVLEGHQGHRHHLVTAMRTREFLKTYYPHFIEAHTITFNIDDIDIEGTPPDELAETIDEVRARHPTESSLHTFVAALRKWSEDSDSAAVYSFHQGLIDSDELAAAAIFLSGQGVKQSFVVYSATPRFNSEIRLSNKEYIEAMRFLLLAPFKMNMEGFFTCRCRRDNPWSLLTHPYHSSNCPLNGRERTTRHTAVCQLLCKLLRKASPTARVTVEPREASAPRHPDIAVEDDALLFHIDVSIVEPTSVQALTANVGSATTKGATAAYKEREKNSIYASTEWVNVVPFVLESTGHLGKEAEALLEKTTATNRALRSWFLDELSLLLARSQGRMRLHSLALLR